jgi:hypothetical protein
MVHHILKHKGIKNIEIMTITNFLQQIFNNTTYETEKTLVKRKALVRPHTA